MPPTESLPRREREAMEVVFEMGSGTAGDIQALLPGQPSYSATRAILSRLVQKGLLNYQQDGPRYVYSPAVNLHKARNSALKKVVETFFGGSSLKTMTALLGISKGELTDEQIRALEAIVANAKETEANEVETTNANAEQEK